MQNVQSLDATPEVPRATPDVPPLTRGKRNVTTEVNLTVLVYNLKRACNLVGVEQLIAAVS